jgi:hypothetical protein
MPYWLLSFNTARSSLLFTDLLLLLLLLLLCCSPKGEYSDSYDSSTACTPCLDEFGEGITTEKANSTSKTDCKCEPYIAAVAQQLPTAKWHCFATACQGVVPARALLAAAMQQAPQLFRWTTGPACCIASLLQQHAGAFMIRWCRSSLLLYACSP